VGSKKNPIWRVVVADQRSPRDGRFIETIGRYNPQTNPSTIAIDEERLEHWIARGAQPTGAVKQLMKAQAKAGGPQVAGAGAAVAEPETEAAEAEPGAVETETGAVETETGAVETETGAAEPAAAPAESGPSEPEAAESEPPTTPTGPADDGEGEPSPAAPDS
jgi:small subunit ribosomal protein S16